MLVAGGALGAPLRSRAAQRWDKAVMSAPRAACALARSSAAGLRQQTVAIVMVVPAALLVSSA